jgi:hypothetical protein
VTFDNQNSSIPQRRIRGGWHASAGTACARREAATRTIAATPLGAQ